MIFLSRTPIFKMALATTLVRSAMSSGVTAQRISKNITLYLNESHSSQRHTASPVSTKPLVLLFPWMGSRPQAVSKYCEIYYRTGFDVLMVETEVSQFLWPRWGLEHGKTVLELLQSERFATRPLLIHAFSIGGYTVAQMLVLVSQDRQMYQGLPQRIRGHIYDSLVIGSLERMAIGVSKNVFPRCEKLVKHGSMFYFTAFKNQTVEYFDRSISHFRDTPVTAPALFFYCENDVLSDSLAVEEVVELWRKRGIDVTAQKWEDSTHAGHMKRHPQEYRSTLETFLHSLGSFVPLKSKI